MGTYEVSQRAVQKNRASNRGRFICLKCSRSEKFSGRSNPNVRYPGFDDGFFETIDSEAKAYLLGWVASDGSITKGVISIFVHRKDASVLDQWSMILGGNVSRKRLRDLVGISVSSQRLVADACRWLGITPGKKSSTVGFPRLADDKLTWAFVRGFFDGDGSIVGPTQARGPRCNIVTDSAAFREAFRGWCPVTASYSADHIEFSGSNALDFLSRLYEGASLRLARKYDLYLDWCVWQPSLGNQHGRGSSFRWVRADKAAVPPTKARASDSGYDLTVIKKVKSSGMLEMFDTGIKVQPDFGWYFDVVPRSSLSKTGYVMANSVGVIDRAYTGTILIALLKIDPNAPELQLPARIAQMIPRPIVHLIAEEVDELDATERGAGGFGSTGR